MVWFWILVVVTLLSFGAQYFLSYRKNKWHGLVLPVIYFAAASLYLLLNLLHVFPQTEVFGTFLSEHGSAGFFALILKIGFLFSPAGVQLILYIVCRHYYAKINNPAKNNKQYKKMIADDL